MSGENTAPTAAGAKQEFRLTVTAGDSGILIPSYRERQYTVTIPKIGQARRTVYGVIIPKDDA